MSADARVVEAHGLTVNNTALTGESDPARRTADPVAANTANLDSDNAVWMGTSVSALGADETRKAIWRHLGRRRDNTDTDDTNTTKGTSHVRR